MKVRASAPGKLMLFGEHAVVYGKPCLVAAVDKYVVAAAGSKQEESEFVACARKLFGQKYGDLKQGFKITGFSSHYGLGSSAAVTVAVARLMFGLKKILITEKELFDFCYQVVKKVQGVGSGFDVAAAVYGGVIEFVAGGEKIEKVTTERLPIVVGYSGVKADTVTMIKKAKENITEEFLNGVEKIVEGAKRAIGQNNWQEVGELMNENQKLLRGLGVSSDKLEALIGASLAAGAWGAKLSGAGGGDCMIAVVSKEKREAVKKAIEAVGGEVLEVKLGAEGVKYES